MNYVLSKPAVHTREEENPPTSLSKLNLNIYFPQGMKVLVAQRLKECGGGRFVWLTDVSAHHSQPKCGSNKSNNGYRE